MMNQKILIIIPAYNEEATIGGVIADIRMEFPEADVLLIDDGSWDSTVTIAKDAGVKALRHPFNMGIGATVQTGYRYALNMGYAAAVQVDADGQHPAREIKRLVLPILKGDADVVIGSRFLGEGRYKPTLARAAGIAIFSKLVSFILKERLSDTTSGFRASGRDALAFLSHTYPDDYPEVESLVLLHKKGFAIMEVPVEMNERKGGRSSIRGWRSAYYMIKVLLAIFVDLLKKV